MYDLKGWAAAIIALLMLLWTVRRDRKVEVKTSLMLAIKAVLAEEGGVEDALADIRAAQEVDRANFIAHKGSDEQQFTDVRAGLAAIHATLQALPLQIVAALKHNGK